MIVEVIHVLTKLEEVIAQLTNEQYCKPIKHLDNASIGQHSRHIIELFQCLVSGYSSGIISYDKRKRDLFLESDIAVALHSIQTLKGEVNLADKTIILQQQVAEEEMTVATNYFRELLYNVEHCIHHQALIKVALKDMQEVKIHEHFGVAYATIAHRKQCAQ